MKTSKRVIAVLLALSYTASAFHVAPKVKQLTKLHSARVKDASEIMKDMRSQLAQNEDANLVMQALRGTNLNDDDAAVEGLEMRLVDFAPSENELLPTTYDPKALDEFFSKRPLALATRMFQLLSVGGGFVFKTALDTALGRMKNNPELEVQRAGELRDLLTSLGPFYIKIGQALSIRPDILSPRAMVELQRLCDKVPSFDSKLAFATIEKELGRRVDEVFSEITPEPVAAASLGQVYKAVLRSTGDSVAVKVQRPNVLETVSLDLHLARQLGNLVRMFPAISDRLDPVALLDEFAFRFYQELDYNIECENGIKVAEDMKVLPDIVIPKNYPKYTARRVHTAQWIEGEKLSQSSAENVGALVNLGVIAYLTQLLETGRFHGDPHPGNMLRESGTGKLVILDFGLMTDITDDQKYGIIEAIIHLINRDYSEIGQDFINLDFIPKGTDTRPIVPALAKVFDAALAGGGAKSINFQDLAADLAEITFEYPFRIPPYFALIIRAISVLEGIALVGNPNFAIVDEAFPYIARRLMTDPSPRLRNALRYMIYGKDNQFDAENLIDLLQALEKFQAVKNDGDGTAFKVNGKRGGKMVGSAGDFSGTKLVDTSDRDSSERFRVAAPLATMSSQEVDEAVQAVNDQRTVREALDFIFSQEGNFFREFMLEEIVNVVDASGRDAVNELLKRLGLSNVPLPSFFRALNPELSDGDRRMIAQIQKLIQFLLGDFDGVANTARLRKLVPIAREYAPQLRDFGTLLLARLTEKNLSRGMKWATEQLAPRSVTPRAPVAVPAMFRRR